MNSNEVIIKVKQFLNNSEFPIKNVYLFGSRAKQIFHADSDYDFLILVQDFKDKEILKDCKRKISLLIHKEFPGISFDLVIKTESDFEENKNSLNSLLNEIYLEGILV